MLKISLPQKVVSINNIHKAAESNKASSITNFIAAIRNTNNNIPIQLKTMNGASTNTFANPSGKLPDGLRQELQELAKTPDQQPVVIERFFSEHMIPLLKAQLNESFSDEQLKQQMGIPVDQKIDDSTLVNHFLNASALKGKLDRFDSQMASYKEQKLDSAKATHLNGAFRALEECIETLLMPTEEPASENSKSVKPEVAKQPTADMDNIDGRTPVSDSAKPQIPTGSGNVYYNNCNFGDHLSGVSADREPVNVNVTVNINGAEVSPLFSRNSKYKRDSADS